MVTGSDGKYQLNSIAPGSILVRVGNRSGWRATLGASAGVSVYAGKTSSRSFGMTQRALVSGKVFRDSDADGRRDAGEAGLSGWRVFADTNQNGTWNSGEISALTDASGNYSLKTLSAGSYVIRVVQQSGYKLTRPSGASYTLALAAGSTSSGRDFGERPS
jgi:hypothetical protein